MIINTNIASLNAQRNLFTTNNSLQKSLEKLSSGYRINRAADDAAGLAISEKMRGQIKGLNQATRNAQDGISLIQTAEGALNETHSILQRMRELAVQAASGTYTSGDQAKISTEFGQLMSEVTRIARQTEFNAMKLLSSGKTINLQIGANSGQTMAVKLSAMSSSALKIDKLGVGSVGSATSAISVVNSAINAVSTKRANFGSYQNRLEHTIANLQTASENLVAAESRIRDVDMAKEMSEFTKNQVLSQAGVAMLAQANQAPQAILKLLG
ncbi:flagellin N-terminal helical domain-containing protein [Paradesulfitobacterium ferrireducens]|uniref:flagellin N-terminal helical domain-containing protein n=1 Tax=Paradesulfitobacterium ferrireducens TaxID=2816476 RepID=UPI001A8D9360|nr:flagellin [Paradesulfitobacterium ferrireducens]